MYGNHGSVYMKRVVLFCIMNFSLYASDSPHRSDWLMDVKISLAYYCCRPHARTQENRTSDIDTPPCSYALNSQLVAATVKLQQNYQSPHYPSESDSD